MRTKHWVCTLAVIIVILMGIHYMTHHKGASVVGSYVPGVK